jgi:hypothetical protein
VQIQLSALIGPTIANPVPYTMVTKRSASAEVRLVTDWLLDRARSMTLLP